MPRSLPAALLVAAVVGATALAAPATESPAATTLPASSSTSTAIPDDERALVRLALPDRAALEALVADGADVASASTGPEGDEVLADVVLTGAEIRSLEGEGAQVRQVIQREGDAARAYEESREAVDRRIAAGSTMQTLDGERVLADTVEVVQAGWWQTGDQLFLQVLATTSTPEPDVTLTAEWETADGETGSFPLLPYTDAGEYLYHLQEPVPVPDEPVSITVTSSGGGTVSQPVGPWPESEPPVTPEGYQSGFITQYMTPQDIEERIDRLAEQYPDLLDVIELEDQTQGYRRSALATLADADGNELVVESVAFGSDGGNDLQARVVVPDAADAPLEVGVEGDVLTVSVATDAAGEPASSVADVADAVGEQAPDTATAFPAPGTSEGALLGAVEAEQLDDGLAAPELSDGPGTVRALRIGAQRDGSLPGVYVYSQEHAREWATPLVTLEFAERMLANAATDEETADLLERTEIFVLPMVNPDGATYSFNDNNWQRRNLVNHCEGEARAPQFRDSWGVDLNRNYSVGSLFDGFFGASTNCTSDVFAGTSELSEPESRNVIQVAQDYPNITHAINVHSFGGYFMWSPGAYSMPGREPLPYPDETTETEFRVAADRIIAAIAQDRGTVTWPSKTGPVVDVLYSAAGNSADELYYDYDIYAWDFEVGNDLWNEAAGQWEGVGFQPPYEEAEAESQEYASGLVELVRVTADADVRATRVSGADRYETAIAIGREAFPEATTAVLVSGEDDRLPDGLVAAPLGRALEAPVLLTQTRQLPNAVVEELQERGVTEVSVVGGEAAVSGAVVGQLEDLDIEVTRVEGENRYETAAAVAGIVGADAAVVSSGESTGLSDALAVSGPAATEGTPILLVKQGSVPKATAAALTEVESTLVTGRTRAVGDAVLRQLPDPTRVGGANRYATAALLAEHYADGGLDVASVVVASGESDHVVDALPGGTLGQAILLTKQETLPRPGRDWLASSTDTERALVLGDTDAVADGVLDLLDALLRE